MEVLSMEFLSALVSIIVLDLVLAGDNAVVIALASRNLPDDLRSKAIYFGTAGAILIRTIMTLFAVYLLTVPYLQALGGAVLIPVALKLLKQEEHKESIAPAAGFWSAIKTIIIADAVMGIDNVLAIAGAARGSFLLVVFGLLISVPVVVWGSKWIGGLMNRYPLLIYVGAGILAWTAGSMIMHDATVGAYLSGLSGFMQIGVPLMATAFVIGYGYSEARRLQPRKS